MSQSQLRAFDPGHEAQVSPPFSSNRPTVGEIVDWFQGDLKRRVRCRPAETERRRIWALLKVALGHRPCDACRPFELLDFINRQPGLDSDWTIKRWNATLQRPFNRAEEVGLIVKNPFRGLRFSEGRKGRNWTDEEASCVIRAANHSFRRLIFGLLFSGLRPGEACNLQWRHLQGDKIVLDEHKTRHKTDDDRVVPLNHVLAKLFLWCRRHNPVGSKFVFLNSHGRRWHRPMADTDFRRLRVKAGLPDNLKLHGCRHTFATRAIANGVSVAHLAQILGHGQWATTQRYVHLAHQIEHLIEPMQQAVKPRPKPGVRGQGSAATKPPPATPLFDGLE